MREFMHATVLLALLAMIFSASADAGEERFRGQRPDFVDKRLLANDRRCGSVLARGLRIR